VQLNTGNLGKTLVDDLQQSDDENDEKFKSRTSLERDRRATEQVISSAAAHSLAGSDGEVKFNANKTFTPT